MASPDHDTSGDDRRVYELGLASTYNQAMAALLKHLRASSHDTLKRAVKSAKVAVEVAVVSQQNNARCPEAFFAGLVEAQKDLESFFEDQLSIPRDK